MSALFELELLDPPPAQPTSASETVATAATATSARVANLDVDFIRYLCSVGLKEGALLYSGFITVVQV
jgi:hypothetical protein